MCFWSAGKNILKIKIFAPKIMKGQPGMMERQARPGELHDFPDMVFLRLSKAGGGTVPTAGFFFKESAEPEFFFGIVQQFSAIIAYRRLPTVNFSAVNPHHGFDDFVLPGNFLGFEGKAWRLRTMSAVHWVVPVFRPHPGLGCRCQQRNRQRAAGRRHPDGRWRFGREQPCPDTLRPDGQSRGARPGSRTPRGIRRSIYGSRIL